jgi:hypothetical protein
MKTWPKNRILFNLINDEKYDAKWKIFKSIDASDVEVFPDFPALTLSYLKKLTLGSYQLKQSCS